MSAAPPRSSSDLRSRVRSVGIGLIAAALALTTGCSSETAGDPTPTTPAGGDATATSRAEADADLGALAATLALSGVTCDEPESNTSPDSSNTYTESMSCQIDAFSASVYRFATDEEADAESTGDPCDAEDNPFTSGMDVWDGGLTQGDTTVEIEHVVAAGDSGADLVVALERFAEAAGWEAEPTCDAPA